MTGAILLIICSSTISTTRKPLKIHFQVSFRSVLAPTL